MEENSHLRELLANWTVIEHFQTISYYILLCDPIKIPLPRLKRDSAELNTSCLTISWQIYGLGKRRCHFNREFTTYTRKGWLRQSTLLLRTFAQEDHSILRRFIADQWKNWILVYSIYSQWNILPVEDLELWRLFVLVCYKICSPCVTVQEVQDRHVLLLHFFSTFQEKYGRNRVTPNMHLHTHLKACILDYGPLCSFWLYSFKQFNGMLGSCSTNNRPVQIQIMRHFFQKQDIGDTLLPEQYRHIFQPILDKIRKDQLWTLEEQIPLPISLLELSVAPIQRCLDWVSLETYTPPRESSIRFMILMLSFSKRFMKQSYLLVLLSREWLKCLKEIVQGTGGRAPKGTIFKTLFSLGRRWMSGPIRE